MDVLHTPLFPYLEDIDKLRLVLSRPSLSGEIAEIENAIRGLYAT